MTATAEVVVDPESLGEEIARTAAHLDAATHRLLACIRAFDASEEWGRQGALSCAHWLSWRIGLDLGTAREKVRVARALGGLPLIDDGLRRGVLSYAKVRALTRVATPENEATLVDVARWCTGAQLERFCRRLRRVAVATEDGDRLDERRFVSCQTLDNGLARICAVLHPDEAAVVMKAIDEARRRRPSDDADAEAGSPPVPADVSAEARASVIPMADALVHVAQSFLRVVAPGTATPRAGTPIVVHLEAELPGNDGPLAACLDDGTRISAETFRRLACDCTVVATPANEADGPTTRGSRTVGPALRRALWARDRGCRFPGCSNRLFVHAHHIQHWAHGGSTTADNLALLCTAHHRLVHEGGFTIQRLSGQPGELSFADARGRPIAESPAPAPLRSDGRRLLERLNAEGGLQIDASTTIPGWDGESLDYDWALDTVIRQGCEH